MHLTKGCPRRPLAWPNKGVKETSFETTKGEEETSANLWRNPDEHPSWNQVSDEGLDSIRPTKGRGEAQDKRRQQRNLGEKGHLYGRRFVFQKRVKSGKKAPCADCRRVCVEREAQSNSARAGCQKRSRGEGPRQGKRRQRRKRTPHRTTSVSEKNSGRSRKRCCSPKNRRGSKKKPRKRGWAGKGSYAFAEMNTRTSGDEGVVEGSG